MVLGLMKTVVVGALTLLLIMSCSSQQQEEQELEATEQTESTEAVDQSTETTEATDDYADIEGDVDPAAADDPVIEPLEELASGGGDEELGAGLSGLGGTDTAAPPAAPPPSDAAPSAQRVVRYVKEGNVPIHSAPNATASQVGSLRKGDRVVVIEEGDWAQINATHFVEKKYLSTKGVGRDRTKSQWQSPGN